MTARTPTTVPSNPPLRPSRSLRGPLWWLVSGAILVSGLLLAGVIVSLRAEALRAGQRLTESFAHVIAEQTTRTLQAIDQRLQLTSASLKQLNPETHDEERGRALLRAEIAEMPFVRALSVTDAQGRILYSTDPAAAGQSVADREYFRIFLAQPETAFSVGVPVRGRVSGAWLISASRPLRSADGSFAGIIVAAVEPPYFDALWQTPDLGKGGTIALFRRDGVMMMRSPFDEASMGKAFPKLSVFSRPLDIEPAGHFVNTSVIDGTVRLFAYRVIPGHSDLVVVVGQAYDHVLEPWRQFTGIVFSVWAAASVAVFILGRFLDRAWTERIKSVESAAQMAQRLALATEASAIGVWDWDLIADRWYATPTYFTMLGYEPGKGILGREDWLAHIHPEDREPVAANIEAALAGEEVPYRHEARVRHADGSYRWLSVIGRVLSREASGRPNRLIGVMVDITESKRAEEALRASEVFSLSILDSVNAEIAVLNHEGVIIAVNEPWKRFARDNGVEAGRPAPRTGVGTDYLSVCGPDDESREREPAGVRAGIRAVLDGRLPRFSLEYSCHSPARQRWFTMNATPLEAGHGGAVVAHIDITERRLAEEALRTSLHEKEGLLKEVHHRVKNNLQVIASLLRLESSRTPEPATKAVLKEMQGRIRSMALLHEALYRSGDFARVDLADYLGQLATQLFRAHNSDRAGVRLTLDLAHVRLDVEKAIPCGLIVNELVTNSLKHAFPDGRPGEVRVSLETEGEHARLRVCDDGAGLPPDFDGRRAKSLGLVLVLDLARQLGGELEIQPGAGASFGVMFPLGDSWR